MTAQQVATAVLALLDPALGARAAYDHSEVPSPRPSEYVAITLQRTFGGRRRSTRIAPVGYRLTLRAVSQGSIENVRNSLERCRAALEYARITAGGETSTRIQFENESPAIPDDGWFSGAQAFTFTI